ncbi:uncharacterized protein LOC123530234 [Mercenaria mercenaria]|uniref:uncharacterized protein LOC123530234 n=1 Tax=Mercenaria mercenaria TaxID=6596 RepID=UPI00234EA514|nr:uncharacterized protein LOC123530234 [Mercenaria mercenaria]
MNQKAERKRNVRPKNDGQVKNISLPFDFRHDLHIGQEEYDERRVDDRPVSPPAPCPGSKDSSGEGSLPGPSISQIIKEDVIPALRSEIGDIVEEKIRKILNENEVRRCETCKTCPCAGKEIRNIEESSYDAEPDYNSNANRVACSTVLSEDSDIQNSQTGMKVIAVSDIQDIEGEQNFRKSFSNPMYHKKTQTFLIQTQHGTKLVKYGSDLQLVHNEQSTKEKSSESVLSRSNTLPAAANRIQSLKQSEKLNHKARRPLSKSDERECLANALQWHIEELVGGIVFKDSELPDDLLVDGCLTEDECARVRKKLDRKDQVRALLSIIKGRDLDVLERFLEHLRSQNENVAKSIERKFEQNKQDGMKCSECALCNLTSNVNLKYIADNLWKNCLIDIGLFNWIIETDRPAGVQGDLWHGVISSLNKHCEQSPSQVRRILGNALTKNHHYHHLAQGVVWMINTNRALVCRCELQHNIMPAGSFLSLQSSRSPQSSESEIVTDSRSDVSGVVTQIENLNIKVAVREKIPHAILEIGEEKAPGEAQRLKDDTMRKGIKSPMPTIIPVSEKARLKDNILSFSHSHVPELKRVILQDANTHEETQTSMPTPKTEFEESMQDTRVAHRPPVTYGRPVFVLLKDALESTDV